MTAGITVTCDFMRTTIPYHQCKQVGEFEVSDFLTRSECKRMKCRDPGSNWGPPDLQSDALPTELSGLGEWCRKSNVVW